MFSSLSEFQRVAVFDRDGKFVLRACPGSGKTYAVAARLAHKLSVWNPRYQGIAALSFTNVAWREIARQLVKDFSMRPPEHPHFLGTIDSFVDRFIFLPYGHLVIGSRRRPELVGPPHGPWSGWGFYDQQSTNVSFRINGEPYLLNPRAVQASVWERDRDKFVNAKNSAMKAGFATQTDANYFAMQVLERFPKIAKALARRFPMIIVDEAQDTSDIQMRICELLLDSGLEHIMLVGDPDQAIFEWHDARPDLLAQKCNEWASNSLVLNENRRSSQNICNFTHPLSKLPHISSAVSPEVRAFPHLPQIVVYDGRLLRDVISDFVEMCKKTGIQPAGGNIAVLSRSKSVLAEIRGIATPTPDELPWLDDQDKWVEGIAKGKYLCDRQGLKQGLHLIEKALVSRDLGGRSCSARDISEHVDKCGFTKWRATIFHLFQILPKAEGEIGNWIVQANAAMKSNGIPIELKIKPRGSAVPFDALFAAKDSTVTVDGVRIATVHAAKGETFDAVLLILKKRGVGKYYKTLLAEGATTYDSEELRIVYVGLTRPRKVLMLAVPDEDNRLAWHCRLHGP